ncbi:MAG: glucosyltransferase domain-containing protein [bacterium]|nr:glucosyltransferase domain-containing protein [bacterium]
MQMKQMGRDFYEDVRGSLKRFGAFSKERRGLWLILGLVLLYLYGTRLFYYDLSFDGEIALNQQDGILGSWLGINRFGLVFTKRLFRLNRFVPYASNFLLVLTLGFSAFFLLFCTQEWSGGGRQYRLFSYVLPLSYVSAPIFAEQYFFSLQAFEVALASFVCMLAVYALHRHILLGKSLLWLPVALFCMVWAFASYQVFASYFIALVLICFVLSYQNEEREAKWFLSGVRFALFFVLAFVLYLLTAKLVKLHFHMDSDYVDSMVYWKTQGWKTCVNNVLGDANRIYRGVWSVFYQKAFTPALLLAAVFALYRGWKRKGRKEYWVYVAAWLLLAFSPLFLSLVSGFYQPIRGQLVFPLVFAFALAGMTVLQKRYLSRILCFFALFATLQQGQIMTQLFHTAYLTYEQDKALAGRVYSRIEQLGADAGLEQPTVVFVGQRGVTLPNDALPGDVIGHSFFEWDREDYAGSTKRIAAFCETLGYRMQLPTQEQVNAARAQAETMPLWPATDSVQLLEDGSGIVIKLSE